MQKTDLAAKPAEAPETAKEPADRQAEKAARKRNKAKRREARKRRGLRNGSFFGLFWPDGKDWKIRVLIWLITALMLVFSGAGLGVMNLYFGTGRYKLDLLEFYFESDLPLVLLNVLPFVILILFLWFVTNRAWISFLLTGVFTLVYSWAEYWKLMARSDPIVAEDLTVVREGMQMGGSYIMITWQIVLSAVLVLAGTLFFFFFLRGCFSRRWVGFCLAIVPVGISFLLYTNVYTDVKLYKSFPCWKKLNKWVDCNQFISRGSIYPFLYSIQSATLQPPEGYTKQEAVRMLEQYPTDDIPEERKVNVIMIMGEAYADLSQCCDRITGVDPYVSYHKLREQSVHGELVTNIFAAGTINTERCVVTGFPYLSNFRRTSWSYARYFTAQGYATQGSHPSYEAFYNRLSVNANLGIERYYYLEDHYKAISGTISPDEDLLPEILRLCQQALETEDYVFSFNVTYQNHGPYPSDKQRFTEVYVPADGLDDYSFNVVNNYLCGVEDTGNRLLELAESIQEEDAPYILVFFGDHKPWMGDQNSVYAALGIDLTSSTEESYFNYYNTEYLIWANDAAKEKLGADFTGEGPAISPCYLMNVLFDLCGWEGPSYMKLSRETQAILPVIGTTGSCVENGSLVRTDDVSERAKAEIRRMEFVTYYLMRDGGGKLPASNE